MTLAELFKALGGHRAVAEALGATPKAVGMWVVRDDVPGEHHLALWAKALDAGLAWEPPGADALRPFLARPATAGGAAAPEAA